MGSRLSVIFTRKIAGANVASPTSSIDEETAEFPKFALTLVRKLRPGFRNTDGIYTHDKMLSRKTKPTQ